MRVRARRRLVLGLSSLVVLAACAGDDPTAGPEGTVSEPDSPDADPTDDGTSRAPPVPTDEGTSRLATPRPTPTVVPAPTVDDRPTTVATDVPRAWLRSAEDAALAAVADTDTDGADTAPEAPEAVVTGAVAVVWPDGSLGCPEPGVNYTQALVEGARIVVDVDGQSVDVRLDDRGNARVCLGGGIGGAPTS